MKKLILIGMGVIGFCANAALVTWGADTCYNGNGGDAPDGWVAYFVEADSNSGAAEKLQAKDFSFLGSHTAETDGAEIAGVISGLGNGVTVSGYMVVFNSDDPTTATYAYVTDVRSASTTSLGGAGNISWGDLDDTDNFSNWTVNLAGSSGGGGVPEPTSGLLLALGGAMLALRRRRA